MQENLPEYPLRVYNTLTKTKEPFRTLTPGKVGMYLCGPTVYAEAHIGHMVGPVIFDTVKRYLTYCGYEVTWVVNITDVDDKLIVRSREKGISMFQLATQMTADYLSNLQALGVDQIDRMPRATDSIGEIIQFVTELVDQGFAYASDGDVFFDVNKDPEYGRLSNRSADEQQGEGGGAASRKRSAGDFALWKSAKPGEPSWPSPWGPGRPGWHIECSAMSRSILGQTFDIHGGGLDLVFPHHENELAQSRCCHSKPMVTYWMHNGLMRASTEGGKVGGKTDRSGAESSESAAEAVSGKISRSKGAGGLAALIAKHTGERIRFFLLRSHYRSTSIFGDEPLAEAGAALDTFYRLFERSEKILGASVYDIPYALRRSEFKHLENPPALLAELFPLRESFLSKMDDDFNTGGATADLFEMARALNRYIDQAKLEEAADDQARQTLRSGLAILREMASLLGIFRKPVTLVSADSDTADIVAGLMDLVIRLRADARTKRDFATSDAIRDGLKKIGIAMQDGKQGTVWEIQR
ncbi:MAG: cysteine--tRNA ligase [Pirellula sp.]